MIFHFSNRNPDNSFHYMSNEAQRSASQLLSKQCKNVSELYT